MYRWGFTDADMEARRWMMEQAKAEGFKTFMDGAGNVFLVLATTAKNQLF